MITPVSILTCFLAIVCAHETVTLQLTRSTVLPSERQHEPRFWLTPIVRAAFATNAIVFTTLTLQAWGLLP